jgi:hypothetical protein
LKLLQIIECLAWLGICNNSKKMWMNLVSVAKYIRYEFVMNNLEVCFH